MRAATLIYNPVAGRQHARREQQIRQAVEVLAQAGIAARPVRTSGPGEARELARQAALGPDALVLVCGGDGTINEVVNGLAPGPATLGILPGGTANVIAKELGLPHHPVRAARQLADWRPRRVPLGLATSPASQAGSPGPADSQLGERYFLSVAGVGFDAHVVYKLSSKFKLSWGVIAYVTQAIHEALRYSFPLIACRVDDQEGGRELEATLALIQRTRRYAGWLHMVPQARFFEPQFHVCLFKSRSRARYFLYAAAVFARQHLKLGDVELVETRQVSCRAVSPGACVRFQLDGELAGELPASFRIVPAALTLLVPEHG